MSTAWIISVCALLMHIIMGHNFENMIQMSASCLYVHFSSSLDSKWKILMEQKRQMGL